MEGNLKNHYLWGAEHFSKEAPGILYDLRPIKGPGGEEAKGLHAAWITLNNPAQYNSYTTQMVKGVIAALQSASCDHSVVAVIITGAGDKAFCTGGNTKEYAEYYSFRPAEYGEYMDLFNGMIDAILGCKKPVICRANGMRVGGGQEVGGACDITLSSDLAIYGQAGPRHGSAPVGGATDFLPWYMSIEDAMWSSISCEQWSAYKMAFKGMISKAIPVIKDGGKWVRNPLVVTDRFVDDGEIVYGEFVKGDSAKKAREYLKTAPTDFELLDKEINSLVWTFTNLFPGCLINTVEQVRLKKKFFWDQAKVINRHWLAANMSTEAPLGFGAFNSRKETGKDVIDFILYRQLVAQGHPVDAALAEKVMPKKK